MKKRKASFYGVRVGKQPGVYDDWEVCKLEVLGFPGSKYKGFQTRSEAENYVNDTLPESAFPRPGIIQTQTTANLSAKHEHCLLPTGTSKRNMPLRSSDKVTSPMKATTAPLRKVTVPKEEVTSPSQPSIKDPSEFYKLVEEKGQQFVFFESLEKFDTYFEVLCHSRHSSRCILDSAPENLKVKIQNETSDVSEHLQKKVAMEDDEFVYFKDEEALKDFLEPYFMDAKQRAVSQTPSYLRNVDALGHGELQRVTAEREPVELFGTEGTYQIEFDGASKGNPGRAGAGALIRCPHGSVVLELTEFLGSETNNVAEYRALILGLRAALSKGIRRVRAQGDSKLVCMQVTGLWKVENKGLIPLHKEVKRFEELFELFSIAHIKREYNSEADALANEAVVLGEPVLEVLKPQPGCCFRSS